MSFIYAVYMCCSVPTWFPCTIKGNGNLRVNLRVKHKTVTTLMRGPWHVKIGIPQALPAALVLPYKTIGVSVMPLIDTSLGFHLLSLFQVLPLYYVWCFSSHLHLTGRIMAARI